MFHASRTSRQLAVAVLASLPLLAAQNVPISPLSGPAPPDIRDIIPAEPYAVPGSGLWLAVGVASLILAAWVLWRFFLRPRPRRRAPGPAPREIALMRLRELERRAGELDARVFGIEVSEVLRAYIGAQFGLHPERQTSQEFLGSIVNATVFSPAEKTFLSEFLDQSDLLKFARLDASEDAKRRLLTQAAEFLQPPSAPAQPAAQVLQSTA